MGDDQVLAGRADRRWPRGLRPNHVVRLMGMPHPAEAHDARIDLTSGSWILERVPYARPWHARWSKKRLRTVLVDPVASSSASGGFCNEQHDWYIGAESRD